MSEKKITLRNISYFLEEKYNFFIPDYQRGYRWNKRQVKDLLDDLNSFYENINSSDNEDEFYCLQPVVVKKNTDFQKNKDLEGSWFEVIDGQQRLTTIYLILYYLNNLSENKERNFSLDYETRLNFADHIDDLTSPDKSKKYEDNIDYFNIHQNYQCIRNWFDKWFNEKKEIEKFIKSIVLKKAKFIWYQVEQDVESIEIFTRINIGKIPLTNAELIKALFLGKVNSQKNSNRNNKEVELKRLEIAKEWDLIEYTLQDDEFWYFIYSGDEDYDTRIEYIFDLMKEKKEKHEDYYTFYEFNEELNKEENDIGEVWLEIKQYFQRLNDWYNDRLSYHYIGYLVNEGKSIDEISEVSKSKTKIEFEAYLRSEINSTIQIEENRGIESLEYGSNNSEIKKILLLFNIQTLLESDDQRSRFPFDLYKKQNWDLEHIHSIKEEMPQNKHHQKEWLNDVEKYLSNKLNNNLVEKIEDFNDSDENQKFEELYNDILKGFEKDSSTDQVLFSINDISNLTLLDSKTNRGYGNAPFPVKRKKIIEKDRTETFIPVCTKNVFLKYYSDDVQHVEYWNEKDSEDYFQKIKRTFDDFIDSETEEEE